MTPVQMMINREIRRVPLDYEHPRNASGHLKALHNQLWDDAMEAWVEEWQQWHRGEHPDQARAAEYTFVEWHGGPPDPESYRARPWPEDAELGIQMYETTSEGTPISKVYPDTDEGRRAMAEELVAAPRGITDSMTVDDWLRVIAGDTATRDIHTGEIVHGGNA